MAQPRPEPQPADMGEILAAELVGKRVTRIEVRRDTRELFIEFDDQSRLFAFSETSLDLSLT